MTEQVAGSAPAAVDPPHREPHGRRPPLLSELSVPLVLAAFATYLLVGLLSMTVPNSVDFPGPRFFPAVIVVVIYALVAVEVLTTLRRRSTTAQPVHPAGPAAGSGSTAAGTPEDHRADPPPHAGSEGADHDAAPRFSWRSLAWVVGGFLLFSLTLEFLGWILGAGLLFWCVARGFGAARPLVSLVVGLTVSSLAYIAFDMALGLSLPSGLLGGGF